MSEPTPTSFIDLMALSPWNEEEKEQFISLRPAFTGGHGLAYGGHVFSQSVWAAGLGVVEGLVVHNVHGLFTVGGLVDRPYIYTITHISEGKSYCTRSVTVRQPAAACPLLPSGVFEIEKIDKELGSVCFTCICSFKRDERSSIRHQANVDLNKTYEVVLQGKSPGDHRAPPHIDTPWYCRYRELYGQANDFPGLDMRSVDMSVFNESKEPADFRQLIYYRSIRSISGTNLNLHACAHLYASDRNGMFIVSNALEFGDQINVMGSLSHSVVFHVDSKDLLMDEEQWWLQESWSPRSEGGRGQVESRIFNEEGVHVASSWQDGMARKATVPADGKMQLMWYEWMGAHGKLPKGLRRDFKL